MVLWVVQDGPDDEVCAINLSSTTAVLQNPPIAHHSTSAQMTTATPWKVLKKNQQTSYIMIVTVTVNKIT